MQQQHPHLKEFIEKASHDGWIFLEDDSIIKIKEKASLTVDLQYDKQEDVFLDADGNVYFRSNTQRDALTAAIMAAAPPSSSSRKRSLKKKTMTPSKRQKRDNNLCYRPTSPTNLEPLSRMSTLERLITAPPAVFPSPVV